MRGKKHLIPIFIIATIPAIAEDKPGDGDDFDETQTPNRFQMHTAHKAGSNDRSPDSFHEARRLSILMWGCKDGGTGYPAVLARLSTAA
jgi:hypothetical protein